MKVKLTRQIRGASIQGEAGSIIECASEIGMSLIEARAAVLAPPSYPSTPAPAAVVVDAPAIESAERKPQPKSGKAVHRVGKVQP